MDTHKTRQAAVDDRKQQQTMQEKELEVCPYSCTVILFLWLPPMP